MSDAWIVVAVVGLATIACKAAGPVLVGRRELPPRLQACVELLAPVMLTALVVTQTFGGDEEIELDARVVGVGAAAIAIVLRAHIIVAMAVAALVTALLRLAAEVARCAGPPPCQNTAAAAIASARRLASAMTRSHCRKCRMCHSSTDYPLR